MLVSLIEVLSAHFPKVQAQANGSGHDYEHLVWEGGDPLPPQETLEALSLTMSQEKVWKLIQAERDRRKSGGYKVGDHWYHSDDTSRIQQIGLMMMGQNLPAGLQWKTLGGEFVTMTPELARQIFLTTVSNDPVIFAKAEYHKAMMYQESNPENYNFNVGWPLTFGE